VQVIVRHSSIGNADKVGVTAPNVGAAEKTHPLDNANNVIAETNRQNPFLNILFASILYSVMPARL
jgi:hypothetical protein